MSGFFLLIVVVLICATSILGLALLSCAIKHFVRYFFFDRSTANAAEGSEKDDYVDETQSNRCMSVSTTTVASSVDHSTYLHNYPKVMVQILIRLSSDHDALQDFLIDPQSHISWPADKLEFIFCIVHDRIDSKKKRKDKKKKKRALPYDLSEELYNLILDRMEDGYRILVTSTSDNADGFLWNSPPNGSLLFTYDSIDKIPSADFLREYIIE
ncbi:hypothetical protein IV203_012475 [Nitzschia inconspicua]|uniref:Uncharacterized protein n=1 Tax=Nitzschia inconspicua TaxID=303405 RepID=A0A9K3KVL9_9STRA|nr:hypothetical protein IV203_012475 [Nitzschia inconspicua]